MDLYSVNLNKRASEGDMDIEACAREIFFESIRMLNKFSLDELDTYEIEDIPE